MYLRISFILFLFIFLFLQTRVNAIKAFPIIAKISPESLPRLADILGQLLQAGMQITYVMDNLFIPV